MFVNRKHARSFVLLLILLSITIGLAACGGDNVPPATIESPTAVSQSTATAPAEVATLPPPVVAMSTHTPLPATETSTATTTPTSTPIPPTGTAVPPTSTPMPQLPAPTAVPPTEPPPPPTEPPPPPIGANGLVASQFALQDRSDFSVNGRVWFEFTIDNTTSGAVSYNALGVMPRKDGVDRFEWYQQTYGGRDSTIDAGGFSWEDNIRLPEPGDYTLRLVMCFDGFDACLQNRGQWFSLSQEIPITIN